MGNVNTRKNDVQPHIHKLCYFLSLLAFKVEDKHGFFQPALSHCSANASSRRNVYIRGGVQSARPVLTCHQQEAQRDHMQMEGGWNQQAQQQR